MSVDMLVSMSVDMSQDVPGMSEGCPRLCLRGFWFKRRCKLVLSQGFGVSGSELVLKSQLFPLSPEPARLHLKYD
eukprot:12739346-Heterocapsa_arctica.AAC.1